MGRALGPRLDWQQGIPFAIKSLLHAFQRVQVQALASRSGIHEGNAAHPPRSTVGRHATRACEGFGRRNEVILLFGLRVETGSMPTGDRLSRDNDLSRYVGSIAAWLHASADAP